MGIGLRTGTVSFLVKRSSVLALCYVVICMIFFNKAPFVIIGALSGAFCGIVRFVAVSKCYGSLLKPDRSKASDILCYLLIQIMTIIMLVFAAAWRIEFFFAAGLGLLIMPFVIFVNGITEALGLTKNKFGE